MQEMEEGIIQAWIHCFCFSKSTKLIGNQMAAKYFWLCLETQLCFGVGGASQAVGFVLVFQEYEI